ncbi:MAG: hypothetical protein NVV72_16375 [Asticcacaulis sp.]|nr:hypothetical protein [Asticcacaulis sp.]
MAQDRSISSWIIWQLLAALQGGCVAGETIMQRATRRSEAALPISDWQVPSLEDAATSLTAAAVAMGDWLLSDISALAESCVAPVSFGGEGEQAARHAKTSRVGIRRMKSP